MLTIFESVFLGAIQGLTEFLPISSSGHLVLIQQLFKWQADDGVLLAFDVALHVGTLLAVVLFFWRDIHEMLVGRAWRLMGLLIIATVPAVIVGLTVKDVIEGMFSSVVVVGAGWIFTGIFLLGTKYVTEREKSNDISWFRALLIGCAQAVAIIPGISRSGSTIVTGLFTGLSRETAARFAFLMAVPAIAGGAILKARDIIFFPREGIPQLVLGTIISFAVGYLTIKWLLSIIQRGKLWWFGVYCWVMGLTTLAVFFFKRF